MCSALRLGISCWIQPHNSLTEQAVGCSAKKKKKKKKSSTEWLSDLSKVTLRVMVGPDLDWIWPFPAESCRLLQSPCFEPLCSHSPCMPLYSNINTVLEQKGSQWRRSGEWHFLLVQTCLWLAEYVPWLDVNYIWIHSCFWGLTMSVAWQEQQHIECTLWICFCFVNKFICVIFEIPHIPLIVFLDTQFILAFGTIFL